jgi:hypothetical protein
MDYSAKALRLREAVVLGSLALLFFFWVIPITGLAGLLSYKEIKKTIPRLGHLIDSNENIRAIVQNSLPSVAMITLNALLPFVLEGLSSLLLYGSRVNALQPSHMYKDFVPGVWSSTHS